MKTISYIITNCGDGSNSIEWYSRPLTELEVEYLEYSDLESYASGDGIQYNELHFPDSFDLEQFFINNNIYINDSSLEEDMQST